MIKKSDAGLNLIFAERRALNHIKFYAEKLQPWNISEKGIRRGKKLQVLSWMILKMMMDTLRQRLRDSETLKLLFLAPGVRYIILSISSTFWYVCFKLTEIGEEKTRFTLLSFRNQALLQRRCVTSEIISYFITYEQMRIFIKSIKTRPVEPSGAYKTFVFRGMSIAAQ